MHANMLRFMLFERPLLRRAVIGRGTHFWVPVRSRGSGTLVIGQRNSFGFAQAPCLGTGDILIQPRTLESRITIGDHNSTSNNIAMVANQAISIGNDCRIGDQVAIYDCDFHEVDPKTRNQSAGPCMAVSVGNNVWVGSRVVILKGVSIGDNSVIAACSVVTKPVPTNVIVAGNPARIIRTLS